MKKLDYLLGTIVGLGLLSLFIFSIKYLIILIKSYQDFFILIGIMILFVCTIILVWGMIILFICLGIRIVKLIRRKL